MTDRHDPIVDDAPHKRRKLNTGESSQKAWDSQDDSGEEFTEHDFHTVATLPQSHNKRLHYTAEQLHSDLGTGTYTTQPTQALHHVTQPTQPLQPNNKSDIQVERSSPITPNAALPQPITRAPFARPGGVLASVMAPPGTAYRRPLGVQPKPSAIDVDSDDDPPIHHSDDESQGGNIRPTDFKRAGRGLDSSPNRVIKESPHASGTTNRNSFDSLLSGFGYQPPAPAKPADDLISAYGGVSRAPRLQSIHRQTGPAKAIPVSSSSPSVRYQTLDDIEDLRIRRKVENMQKILGSVFSIQRLVEALARKRGNEQDAMELLSDEQDAEERDELSLSPIRRKGVAQSTSQSSYPSQPARPTAKQQVQAPVRSIAQRYARGSARNTTHDSDDEDEDDVKPRRARTQKVVNPRSSPSPSSPLNYTGPQQRQRLGKKQVIVVHSDSEGDSGVGRDTSDELEQPTLPEHVQIGVQELREDRLLKLINDSTAHDLAELSGQPEETIRFVLDKRPFNDLEAVRAVTMETLTKTGKKSKKTKAVGDKLVDDCMEVMTGYDAIDELVVQCEKLAQPVQEALRGWGVGDSADGELQLMSLDEAQDSGIGTPASSCTPDDAPAQKAAKMKGGFIGQPENMSPNLIMKNYQLVGLNWLYMLFKKGLSCILADDMGLGKTCQVIAFLSYLQVIETDGVHLIIVPGSTLENWLREFERFAPSMQVRPYYGSQSEREELRYDIEQQWSDIDVIVTTYDMAVGKDDNKFLRTQGPYSVCVYDEAHTLKNTRTTRYRSLVRIEADCKVLLTGTPLQNNLQELIAILAFIMPGLFQKKRDDLEYIFKHKASTKDTASAALLSSERIARARTMMTPFILRRKKAQVLDLPAKTSRVEYCEMTESQAHYYHDVLEEAQNFYKEKARGAAKSAKQSSNVIMALRKAAIHPLLARHIYDDKKLDKLVAALQKSDEFGGNPRDMIRAYLNGDAAISLKGGDFGLHRFCHERPFLSKQFALRRQEWMDAGKVKKFEELVTRYAANGDRVLVFSQFTTLMDILETVLEQLHIKFMRLDGSTRMDTRQEMIDQFYQDVSITVFMLSTRAGGAGINLAAANKVIIFDSGFNPQDDIQAENRAHRVGQTREVEVVRLVTRGTIEEQIHALGESKLALDDRVAGEGASAAEAAQTDKAGEQLVMEQMFANDLKPKDAGDGKPIKSEGDIKDAFRRGLEGEGLRVASKQAQL